MKRDIENLIKTHTPPRINLAEGSLYLNILNRGRCRETVASSTLTKSEGGSHECE